MCKIQQESSLKPPDVNLIESGSWNLFFWFPYINPYCCHIQGYSKSFFWFLLPQKLSYVYLQKNGWSFPSSQPSLQGEDRNLLISPIRMFDVNTIILHEFKADGRLRRLTGTLQKTLQSLEVQWSQKVMENSKESWDATGGCYAKFGVCFYQNLRFETNWCSKGADYT